MQGYDRDHGRHRPGGRGDHPALPAHGGFWSHGGHGVDVPSAEARRRQIREERRFQQQRAAPGEEPWWEGEAPRGDRPSGMAGGPRMGPAHWQPEATPTAGDLMTEDPEAVTPETTLQEAARRMRDLDVGILPVVDDRDHRRLQGVITDRDLAMHAIAEGSGAAARVGDCMTREVATCHPDHRVRDVLHIMEREQVRRVPVVDHAGSLVGIIAQADLAVDFGAREPHRALRVENAIERISSPARPRGR